MEKLCTFRKKIKNKKKERIPTYLEFCTNYLITKLKTLSENQSPEQMPFKESLISLISFIGDEILQFYPDALESLIGEVIVKNFSQEIGNLNSLIQNESAISFIYHLSDHQFKNVDLIKYLYDFLCHCLTSNCMIINVHAAITIPLLIRSNPSLKEVLRPNISSIFELFFKKILLETELEQLLESLTILITEFKEDVLPFSLGIAKELISLFSKYIEIEQKTEEEPLLIPNLQDVNESYDSLCSQDEANLGYSSSNFQNSISVLNTLGKLIEVACESNQNEYLYVRNITAELIPILSWGVSEQKNSESFLKSVLEILSKLLNIGSCNIQLLNFYGNILHLLLKFEGENCLPGIGYEDNLQLCLMILKKFLTIWPEDLLLSSNPHPGCQISSCELLLLYLTKLLSIAKEDEIQKSYIVSMYIAILEILFMKYAKYSFSIIQKIIPVIISELKVASNMFYKIALINTVIYS
jgi:hypothetical protein